ncbi:hypothetical protein H4I96_11235 [Botrytis cinerea]
MASLSPHGQVVVRRAFAWGDKKRLAMILGFCAAEVLALGLVWEGKPRRLAYDVGLMDMKLANDRMEEDKTNCLWVYGSNALGEKMYAGKYLGAESNLLPGYSD